MSMRGRWGERALLVILAAYCAALAAGLFAGTDNHLWDFKTYYWASRAAAEGLNPYDTPELARFAGTGLRVGYVYPPATLWLFRPLASLGYDAASRVWLGIKWALAAALVLLWARAFLGRVGDALFYVFCLLGFNGALYLDLRAGNVTALEQCLLWSAFLCLLKRRLLFFCVLTIAASAFKISPALFLGLLLFTGHPASRKYFLCAVIACAALLALDHAAHPALFGEYLRAAAAVNARGGILNPSTYWFFRDLFLWCGNAAGFRAPGALAAASYAASCGAVLGTTVAALNRIRRRGGGWVDCRAICLSCAAVTLILPRCKDYSYVIMLLPAYVVFREATEGGAYPLLYLAGILPSPAGGKEYFLPIFGAASVYFLWSYYPLIICLLVWTLYVREALCGKESRR